MNNYKENYKCIQVQKFIDGDIKNLLLLGKTGTGKTYALNYIKTKLDCKIYNMSVYVEHMNECLYPHGRLEDLDSSTRYFWENIRNAKVVLIDDMGIENTTENNKLLIYKFLNERVGRGCICTNLSKADLFGRYDDRIISRLIGEYNFVEFEGDDWRMKNFKIEKAIF